MDGTRKESLPYLFVLPSLVFILTINGVPFVSGIYYSFLDGTLINNGTFQGFANFLEVFRMEDFWQSLYFTIYFSIFSVIGSYVFGLALALILNKDIPGRGFFRIALLVPMVIPLAVSVIGWRWLIQDQNAQLNDVLSWFGIQPILFLADQFWAQFTVIMINIWGSYPFMMIMLIAGLSSIDSYIYESAHIDGASKFQSFLYITLPQLKTISIVLGILTTIANFNNFGLIWLLTQGGPINATQNLIIMAYKYTFTRNMLGIGAAIAVISLVIMLFLATLVLKGQRKLAEED